MGHRQAHDYQRRQTHFRTRDAYGYINRAISANKNAPISNRVSSATDSSWLDYPDTTGTNELHARFWQAKVDSEGIVHFPRPDDPNLIKRHIRAMESTPPNSVGLNEPNTNFQ